MGVGGLCQEKTKNRSCWKSSSHLCATKTREFKQMTRHKLGSRKPLEKVQRLFNVFGEGCRVCFFVREGSLLLPFPHYSRHTHPPTRPHTQANTHHTHHTTCTTHNTRTCRQTDRHANTDMTDTQPDTQSQTDRQTDTDRQTQTDRQTDAIDKKRKRGGEPPTGMGTNDLHGLKR